MAKDILLYGHIGEYNALYFHEQIAEATEEDEAAEMTLRVNSGGGSPEYSQAIIQKVQELAEQMYVKIGAMAHSAAFFLICYLETSRVECVDVTQAVIHRAAYPSWIESDASFVGSVYETILAKINKDLEKALRAKVNVETLEALPQFAERNLKLKDIFSMEARHEVVLTGADLKKLGLVNRVVKITPTKTAEMRSQAEAFDKCRTLEDFRVAASATTPTAKPIKESQNDNIMNLEELRAAHPALVTQIEAAAKTAGAEAERKRISAWMKFSKIDAVAVAKGITDGSELTADVIADFSMKAIGAGALANLNEDSQEVAPVVGAGAVVKAQTDKEKEEAAFLGQVNALLGRTKKVA